jgi:hypothetical protein
MDGAPVVQGLMGNPRRPSVSDVSAKLPVKRTVGVWLAAVMAALQALNALRSFADPIGYAAYMGLPLADAADTGFVLVYGLRAAFIALLVFFFLMRG